ncbi:ABC transporter ATP-binding protein [Metabacillus malikii]|uniref:Nickel import system ATP-binding protein NikD n=1 Tax=Metabacillus malikii TaxID=1504265 RepID=A0ABT9ZL85_9BACI|nr:ABC transporter ATP-binding protein [Metabacillus malikii]MDQ0233067.1 peptide/nickel transport system ATP-binding protein [Metabacillus malikii]
MSLLEVENLSVTFTNYTSMLRKVKRQVIANLSLSVEAGEIVAVVGASGSGKSLLAHAILGILPVNSDVSGTCRYKGTPLTAKRQKELRGNEICLVPQSVAYLDPLMKIGKQVQTSVNTGDAVRTQRKVFERYRLAKKTENMYPFQLSGGMARRALLATAVISEPQLIIADEPTPGLDAIVIEEALANLRELAENGCAVLLISHDIEAALKVADKIAVFYAGTTVEVAPVEDFTGKGELLRHPYSKALWRALPQNEFIPIKGTQPQPNHLPTGCVFEPRCERATAQCRVVQPVNRTVREGMVRCFHAT